MRKFASADDMLSNAHPEPNTGCWLWPIVDQQGYGSVYVGHKPPKNGKHRSIYKKAHRLIYELAVGPIPSDRVIDHKCRQRSCINPNHIRLATPRQNALENSMSVSARYSQRSTCNAGHPLDGSRRSMYGKIRKCLECYRKYRRDSRARIKARALVAKHEDGKKEKK